MNKKKITPDYTARAIKKYQESKDRCLILFPKGTKERIKETGESVNGLINKLVMEYLEGFSKQ